VCVALTVIKKIRKRASQRVEVIDDGAMRARHTLSWVAHRHQCGEPQVKIASSVGSVTYEVPTGTFVMVPIGEPHTFANPFDEDAEFITTYA